MEIVEYAVKRLRDILRKAEFSQQRKKHLLKTKFGVRVHFESGQIIYSPSDLTLYMESPFASLMEHLACIEPCTLDMVDKEDSLLSVLQLLISAPKGPLCQRPKGTTGTSAKGTVL
jgi:hypothetical protein